MRTMIIPIAALALASCHGTPDQNAPQSPDIGNASTNYSAEVAALPESQRNIVFIRAIRDAGLDCQGVTRSERIADITGAPTWRAECNDGTAHLVQVKPDGTAVVTNRVGP